MTKTAAQKRLAKIAPAVVTAPPPDRWFAVTTNPGQEAAAAGTALRFSLGLFLPRLWVNIHHDHRRRRQLRFMFPRTIFVRPMLLGDESWVDGMSNKPGFRRIGRDGGKILPIPAKQMERFRGLFDADGVLIPPAEPDPEPQRFPKGARVPFETGVFSDSDIVAEVLGVDERDRVHVLVSLLGRMVEMQVPADQLGEPISPVPEAGARAPG